MSDAPSKKHYEKRAKEGYGLVYPDGHVIRIWERFLKHQIPDTTNLRMLDFGCWNGTHTAYFESKGFDVSGVDIVGSVLEEAAAKVPNGTFRKITDETSLESLFSVPFDLIFANQVLYFIGNDVFMRRLAEFDALLAPGGHVVFTMMSRENTFSRYARDIRKDGLETIKFPQGHRFAGKETYVRFTESDDHLKNVFARFECLTTGFYDISVSVGEYSKHWIFIGKKKTS